MKVERLDGVAASTDRCSSAFCSVVGLIVLYQSQRVFVNQCPRRNRLSTNPSADTDATIVDGDRETVSGQCTKGGLLHAAMIVAEAHADKRERAEARFGEFQKR